MCSVCLQLRCAFFFQDKMVKFIDKCLWYVDNSVIPLSIVGAHRFYATLTNFLGLIGYWAANFISVILVEHFIFRKYARKIALSTPPARCVRALQVACLAAPYSDIHHARHCPASMLATDDVRLRSLPRPSLHAMLGPRHPAHPAWTQLALAQPVRASPSLDSLPRSSAP